MVLIPYESPEQEDEFAAHLEECGNALDEMIDRNRYSDIFTAECRVASAMLALLKTKLQNERPR